LKPVISSKFFNLSTTEVVRFLHTFPMN